MFLPEYHLCATQVLLRRAPRVGCVGEAAAAARHLGIATAATGRAAKREAAGGRGAPTLYAAQYSLRRPEYLRQSKAARAEF